MRVLALIVAAAALAGCGGARLADGTFTFDAGVAPEDRAWIEAAVAKTRPEARQLIAAVDGMVTIATFATPGSGIVGLMQQLGEDRYSVSFNLAYLDGARRADRDVTVAHELGHVIDAALVTPELRDRLVAALPPGGVCLTPETGDCTAPAERFADTFAKWALRGAVSAFGAGYGVLPPASLESWGAPLARLAVEAEVAARELSGPAAPA